jgi:hypothetical protein
VRVEREDSIVEWQWRGKRGKRWKEGNGTNKRESKKERKLKAKMWYPRPATEPGMGIVGFESTHRGNTEARAKAVRGRRAGDGDRG